VVECSCGELVFLAPWQWRRRGEVELAIIVADDENDSKERKQNMEFGACARITSQGVQLGTTKLNE
jgi:hypothetical protein